MGICLGAGPGSGVMVKVLGPVLRTEYVLTGTRNLERES